MFRSRTGVFARWSQSGEIMGRGLIPEVPVRLGPRRSHLKSPLKSSVRTREQHRIRAANRPSALWTSDWRQVGRPSRGRCDLSIFGCADLHTRKALMSCPVPVRFGTTASIHDLDGWLLISSNMPQSRRSCTVDPSNLVKTENPSILQMTREARSVSWRGG